MATKDTGGQRQTTRRSDETEEAEASSVDEVKERHEKLSDDVDAILDEIDEVLRGERGGVRPFLCPEGRSVSSRVLLTTVAARVAVQGREQGGPRDGIL